MINPKDLLGKNIKINTPEEWVKVQLLLLAAGFSWADTGKTVFRDITPNKECYFFDIHMRENYTLARSSFKHDYTLADILKL